MYFVSDMANRAVAIMYFVSAMVPRAVPMYFVSVLVIRSVNYHHSYQVD